MSELPVSELSLSSSPITSDSADSNQMKIVEPITNNNTDTNPTPVTMPINNTNNNDSIVNNINSNNCSSTPELVETSVKNEIQEMKDPENNNNIGSDDEPNHDGLTKIREDTNLQDQSKESKKRNIADLMEEPVTGLSESQQPSKRPMTKQVDHDRRKEKDDYCWNCHKDRSNISCNSCPRSFHTKCLPLESPNPANESNDETKSCKTNNWVCPECTSIMKSEDLTTRSSVLSHLNPHEFAELLMFAVQTIKAAADRSFHQPVSETIFPDYRNYVVYPMDFSTIEKNIRAKIYGCTEALMADIKYIVHNCYIYNSPNHPLTKNANYFLKVARNEMQEIEICPNCFRNFYTIEEKKWFIEPCARPHILVYAKMRGYPPWPAKVVRYDKEKNEVDVRFFGAHDRSWIPADSCHLLSKPNFAKAKASGKGQKNKIDVALNELEQHINRLNELFPFKFNYAKSKEPINVNKLFICDGNSDEEISPLDDDRDSDLNEDKLVIDETGDDLDDLANGTIENKTEIETPIKPVPEVQVKSEKSEKPKSTVPKYHLKTPIGPLTIPQPAAPTPSSPDKADVKKPLKKKGKNKKNKEKLENVVVNANSTKKSELKKKISIKPLEEEPSKKSEEYEQLKRKLDFEKLMHKEQIREMEHNHNLLIREMRESWVKEKERALNELEEKHKKEMEEAKKKQWCSECLKEAMYFCCWNTSYCSHNCQKAHWPKHALKCQQQQHNRQAQSTATQQQQNQQPVSTATPSQVPSQPSTNETTSRQSLTV